MVQKKKCLPPRIGQHHPASGRPGCWFITPTPHSVAWAGGSVCFPCHVVTAHNFSWGPAVRGLPGHHQVLPWSPVAKLTNLQDPFLSPLPVQAQKSGAGGSTQAAEDLLLLGKPLTDLVSLLIPLVRAQTPARASLGSLLRVKWLC